MRINRLQLQPDDFGVAVTNRRRRAGCFVLSRVLALLALSTLFVFLGPPEPTMGWNALFDVGHFVLFFVGTWIVIELVGSAVPGLSLASRTGAGAALSLLAAAFSETAQTLLPSRIPSALDLLRDSAGIAAAAVMLLGHGIPPSRMLGAASSRFIGGLLFVTVLTPLLLTVGVYRARDRQFPVLATMEGAWWESWLVTTQSARLIPGAAPGRFAILRLQPSTYPGLTVREPYPDWTGFTQLTFAVRLDADRPVTLGVHVQDRWYNGSDDDRFNQNVVIQPGTRHVAILLSHVKLGPRFRPLDLTAIRGIRVYAVHPGRPVNLHLGAIRLK